jgi:hypothetical protein
MVPGGKNQKGSSGEQEEKKNPRRCKPEEKKVSRMDGLQGQLCGDKRKPPEKGCSGESEVDDGAGVAIHGASFTFRLGLELKRVSAWSGGLKV